MAGSRLVGVSPSPKKVKFLPLLLPGCCDGLWASRDLVGNAPGGEKRENELTLSPACSIGDALGAVQAGNRRKPTSTKKIQRQTSSAWRQAASGRTPAVDWPKR